MATKTAKKSGSGSQKPAKKLPASDKGKSGADEEEEEEEEEEETEEQDSEDSEDDSEDSDDKSKDGKEKGEQKGKKGELDLSELPEHVQKHIKDLRRESAKYRTKAKNLADSHTQLSERIKKLAGTDDEEESDDGKSSGGTAAQQAEALAFDNAILQAAVSHGVPKEGLKYFRFLVAEKTSELEDGEELDDDDLAEIAEEARAKKADKQKTKTSVTTGTKGNGAPDTKTKVSVETFARMTVSEKTNLRAKNPELYSALFKEASDKNLLFR